MASKGNFGQQFRKAYSAGRQAYQREEEVLNSKPVFIVFLLITLLGAVLFEVLEHYTTWPFTARIVLTVAAIVLAQYIATRLVNRPLAKNESAKDFDQS